LPTKKKTDKKRLKKGDILLLLLYVDNCSSIRGRTRLQKMIFVFEKEIYEKYGFNKKLERIGKSPFEFNAHNFGPFSSKVFELMDFFINIKMVDVKCAELYEETEEAIDSIDDEDIYFDDLNELVLEDEEPDYCREPEYSISKSGKQYLEDNVLPYLSSDHISALTKLKKSFNEYSLNRILKYIYSKYPEMAKESTIKDKILEWII
jgi:hypothetical protein